MAILLPYPDAVWMYVPSPISPDTSLMVWQGRSRVGKVWVLRLSGSLPGMDLPGREIHAH